MKKLLKILGFGLLGLLALALVVPFLIPVETSGTKSYQEAAGPNATFFEASGVDVYYEKTDFVCTAGKDCSNPPVIFLMHGFGAHSFSFDSITAELSELGDVIAYDRPGFGFTERPTSWIGENPYGSIGNDQILDDLISNFAAGRKVILIGHSAGGTLAAQYAIDNREKVQGLILISPAILTQGGSPSWLNWVYSIPQLDHLGPLLVSSIASSGMDLLYRSWYDQSLITEETISGYRAPLEIAGWEEGFWEFNRAPRSFDVQERIAELDLPVLLITGDTDTVVATRDTEELASLIPSSVLFVIPKSGHLAQEESPDQTMKAIKVTWSILTR